MLQVPCALLLLSVVSGMTFNYFFDVSFLKWFTSAVDLMISLRLSVIF